MTHRRMLIEVALWPASGHTVRVVSGNSRTLKFRSRGLEEDWDA